jgi:hypothetical protein
MIVDSHVHIYFDGSDPEPLFLGFVSVAAAWFGRHKSEKLNVKESYKHDITLLFDKTGERLINDMRKAKIDKSILLPLDFWLKDPTLESQGMPIKEKNDLYGNIVAKYPDKLKTYFGVDPRRKNAIEMLDQAMKSQEPIGIKIHPTSGFYPDDPKICYSLYKRAAEYDLPIVIHSGAEPYPMEAKYSHPMYIDSVAANFPDTTIIVAHCGHGWWQQTINFASQKPNLYVDFSGWQFSYLQNPDYFWTALRKAIDAIGPWRVLFGSDGNVFDAVMTNRKWVRAVSKPSTDIKFTEEEIEIFMGKAAQKLYSL